MIRILIDFDPLTAASYSSSAAGFASYLVADHENAKTYFGFDADHIESLEATSAAANETAFKTFDAIRMQVEKFKDFFKISEEITVPDFKEALSKIMLIEDFIKMINIKAALTSA